MTTPIIAQNQIIMWSVVAVYMIIITLAGSYYSKYMRTADAYFKAGNLIPWWAAGISMYMANFTAYTFVAIASLVYIDGMAGLILETGPALAYFTAAIVFARRWHRLNLTSPPEYLEARFNPLTRKVFSSLGIASAFIASGLRLYAMSKLVESLMGLPLIWTIVITGSVMIAYTMLGGLWAVIVTDIVQFIVLFLAVVPLFIIAVASIFIESSWAEFVSRIPPQILDFPKDEHGRTLGWLLAFWFAYLLDLGGDWGTIQRLSCTPSEADAKKAALLSTLLSIPHAFLLLGPCFIARVMWPGEIGDPAIVSEAERVYGKVAVKLLPAGLIGVVAAAMFSATMSTLSVSWSVRSTSFVNDLYARFLRPEAGDREKILVGRLAVLAIGAVATTVAIVVSVTSSGLFSLAQDMIGLIVIPLILPLLLGLLLRRARRWAGLAGLATCLGVAVFNRWGYFLFGLSTPLPFEYEIIVASSLTALVMSGSRYWPENAEEREQVNRFFARMEQPRPAIIADGSIPAPLGVIGSFTILIGLLVLLLTALPQSMLNRAVTLMAASVLFGVGWTMKRRHRRMA